MLDFRLESKSVDILRDISFGIGKRLESVRQGNKNMVKILDSLKSTMFDELLELSGDANMSSFKENNKGLVSYIDFMSKAGILSYYGMLDNDKNIAKLKEQDGVELEFAFDGFGNMVSYAVEMYEDSETSSIKTTDCIQSCLLSMLREVSLSDYISGGYADKDIRLIAVLGNKSKSELNEFITKYIRDDDTFNSCYSDSLAQVLAIYKYLFQDSFGLRPYIGVVSFSSPYIRIINDSMRLDTLPNARVSFDAIRSTLASDYDVHESLDRQFDIKAVIKSSDGKPFYYPVKMLEYAMGRELTYELSENVYRNYANNKSWDEYAEGYVKPQITNYFHECIYYSLERHFNFGGKNGESVEDFFISDDFAFVLSNKGEMAVKTYMASADMIKKIKADINRLKKCLCTAVIAVDYNNLGNKVNSIALRCVNTTGNLRPSMTKSLFSQFTTNESTKFGDGEVISNGKCIGGDASKPLPYDIIEYRHNFDSALATAEPLFGYKAVEMFQARGIKLGWGKILLGEDIKGTPVFASIDDPDDFPMQRKAVHNMMAGSRSGKGVMTMNILVSGIASGKPIFYIDRKPDMAVLFYELSGGNMFVVNGGQYEGKNDINKFFSDTGVAVSGWSEAYERMPEYLKKSVFKTKTYTGDFGDYVYFRAIIFTLGILMARVELAGNGEVYNKLGGDSGIVIIIDEFKNWQMKFESGFFTPAGVFGNEHRLTKTMIQGYKKAISSIKMKMVELETLDESDPKSAVKIAKLNLDIENLRSTMAESISELDVYCTTLMNKYGESVKHISSKLSAGFGDSEGSNSDIFVIGQNIEIDGFNGASEKSGTYPERDSGGFNVNADTKGKSLMRGVLDMFKHDWFMGYNVDEPSTKHYLNADSAGTPVNKWVTQQRYWAYCPDAEIPLLRHACPSDAKFFKPYLVLNKHFEDDPNDPMKMNIEGESEPITHPDYVFVSQCRSRVNGAVPGAKLWETVRLKHLKSELMAEEARSGINKHYGELNEGIGFEGLANRTKMCNGMGNFSPEEDLGASKVIADYVAQCMGYSCYLELLFDFTPNGLFSTQDICNALANPEVYRNSTQQRLPLFEEYNFLDGINGESEESGSTVIMEDSDFYSEDMYADMASEFGENTNSGVGSEGSHEDGFENEFEGNSGDGFDRNSGVGSDNDFNMSGFSDSDNIGSQSSGFTGSDSGNSGFDDDFDADSNSGFVNSGFSGSNNRFDTGKVNASDLDLIELCTEVTTSVFMVFVERYGNNVRDNIVKTAITTYARNVIYDYVASQKG